MSSSIGPFEDYDHGPTTLHLEHHDHDNLVTAPKHYTKATITGQTINSI